MEYIEKAKYELIMALKNNESKDIIDFLKQYYTDMVNIVSKNKDDLHKTNTKYILNFSDVSNTDRKESFVFSNKEKLQEFYVKYNMEATCITVLELHDIDPENNFRPNTEIDIDKWLK
jgi:hypothetical protein